MIECKHEFSENCRKVTGMKLHYMKKFNGDLGTLPHREHEVGAVQFKEPEDMKKLGLLANGIALVMCFVTIPVLYLKGGFLAFNIWGCIVSTLCLFPHEFIHAICFREDVYLYTNLKNGMLFVTGTEDMSKFRFVFMSLLPNFVFGFVPFILFMINPSWGFAGTLGALSIPMGAGDYLNVFNAIRQVPKGAKIYMSGMHSYWYML